MSKKEYRIGEDPGIEWWKKRKFYEGHISEFTISVNENFKSTYEEEKAWLDKIRGLTNDEKTYKKKLKELKEKYGVDDI